MATHLEPIALRVHEINKQIKELEAEKAVHCEHLIANLTVGTHLIGGLNVIVSQPKPRWSAQGKRDFAKAYPEAENPEFFTTMTVLDTEAADQVLTDIERDAYLIPAKKQVTVK